MSFVIANVVKQSVGLVENCSFTKLIEEMYLSLLEFHFPPINRTDCFTTFAMTERRYQLTPPQNPYAQTKP